MHLHKDFAIITHKDIMIVIFQYLLLGLDHGVGHPAVAVPGRCTSLPEKMGGWGLRLFC
jgi:hypothetical protein